MLHALAVDDDAWQAKVLTDALRDVAMVQHEERLDDALGALASVVPDVLLYDLIGTADAHPVDAARSVRIALDAAATRARIRTRIPIVLVSGCDPHVLSEIASAVEETHAVPKPFSPRELRALVLRVTGASP